MLSFVYDIADLYKADFAIPAAFDATAAGTDDLEPRVRKACRDAFRRGRLLARIVYDIQRLLNIPAAPDLGEFDDDAALPGGLWDPVDGVVQGGVNWAEAWEQSGATSSGTDPESLTAISPTPPTTSVAESSDDIATGTTPPRAEPGTSTGGNRMIVLIMERVPASLRGELSRWMLEARAGVFVGDVSGMVRDKLWDKACKAAKEGSVLLIHSADTEQGFAIRRLWPAGPNTGGLRGTTALSPAETREGSHHDSTPRLACQQAG